MFLLGRVVVLVSTLFLGVFLGLVIVGVCVGSFVPLFLNNSCFNFIIHVWMFYNS